MTTVLVRPRGPRLFDPRPDRGPVSDGLLARGAGLGPDIVDVWGQDSFPASDPPANW